MLDSVIIFNSFTQMSLTLKTQSVPYLDLHLELDTAAGRVIKIYKKVYVVF